MANNAAEIHALEQYQEKRRENSRAAAHIVASPSNPWPNAGAFHDEYFVHKSGLSTVLQYRDELLQWLDGRYTPIEIHELNKMLYKWLEHAKYITSGDETRPFAPSEHKLRMIVSALRARVHLPADTVAPTWLTDEHAGEDVRDFIVFKNGILHVPTEVLHEHTPALFTLTALPYEYHRTASAPTTWISFLRELWPNDNESIETLQEWFGYCLVPDTRLQKMLAIIGPTRAGKGVIARVLSEVVGRANVAGPTLASFESAFGLEPLLGKLLAIISDARLSGRADQHVITERLLSISGEDSLSIPRKYRSAWEGTLPTRIMMLSNEVPRFNDASLALPGRFIFLTLTKSFLGKEDETLTDRILAELPGVFLWALEGLWRLRARSHFRQPASSAGTVDVMHEMSSPIASFVDERCVLGEQYRVAVDHLYDEWKHWAEGQGMNFVTTVSTFGRDLRAAHPEVVRRRPRNTAGERIPTYYGIGLLEKRGRS